MPYKDPKKQKEYQRRWVKEKRKRLKESQKDKDGENVHSIQHTGKSQNQNRIIKERDI